MAFDRHDLASCRHPSPTEAISNWGRLMRLNSETQDTARSVCCLYVPLQFVRHVSALDFPNKNLLQIELSLL
jgi:hypothetical protein